MVERLAIVGLGLIGGSLAAALKQRHSTIHLTAVGRRRENLLPALEQGLVDEASDDLSVVARADMVVLGVPVGQIGTVMRRLRPSLRAETIVTDVGSTKVSVIRDLTEVYGRCPEWFVPAHPLAGKESSGYRNADPDLFVDRKVLLTPVPETGPVSLLEVRRLWETVGAEVSQMDAAQHDRTLGWTSHLPHLLAFALLAGLGEREDSEAVLRYAAGGFRDFSRIAASDPVMWRDIFLANRESLLALLAQYQADLDRIRTLLRTGAGEDLETLLRLSKQVREKRFPPG